MNIPDMATRMRNARKQLLTALIAKLNVYLGPTSHWTADDLRLAAPLLANLQSENIAKLMSITEAVGATHYTITKIKSK